MLLPKKLRLARADSRNSILRAVIPALLLFGASAQVAPPGPPGVSMGHLHFHSADRAAHKRFWIDVFGAQPVKAGNLEIYRIPGMFIALDEAKPSGGMEGSTVPTIGLEVRNLKATLKKAKLAHATIAKRSRSRAVVVGPDQIRIELTADRILTTEVAADSIQIDVPSDEARAWYAKTFGDPIPGIRLVFTKSEAAPAGTKGRVLDHIGFEISNLREFTKALAASGQKVDLMYYKLPDSGIAIGFVTDPWGTYIELTDGLVRF